MSADWRPAAPLANLRRRAQALAVVRGFFAERGVLEVETPCLASAGVTDPNIEGFTLDYDGPGAPPDGVLWLQTSPEYAMKRLLAAGSGPIYQITRGFRAGERGRWHNPEFSLLEWYRPGFDAAALRGEVAELVAALLGDRPVACRTYAEVFRQYLGIDPLTVSHRALGRLARVELSGLDAGPLDRDALLDALFGSRITPDLGRDEMTFVTQFPASQAALARLSPADQRVAERFELFIDGVEIANGFHELGDAAEQGARFQADRARRTARGQVRPMADQRLLAALEVGLPDTSGVALGLDRLIMLLVGASRIDEVMAFPVDRA